MTHFTDKIIIIDQKIKLLFLLFQKKRYIFLLKLLLYGNLQKNIHITFFT